VEHHVGSYYLVDFMHVNDYVTVTNVGHAKAFAAKIENSGKHVPYSRFHLTKLPLQVSLTITHAQDLAMHLQPVQRSMHAKAF
jgi:hypothetical protein